MRNNKGFGKFEVLTVMVICLIIFCVLFYTILGASPTRKMKTMQEDAISFTKTATTNNNSFHNTETFYLKEVIDEKLMEEINNPFGKGSCSSEESKIEIEEDGFVYTTLKCGEYLIDHAIVTDGKDVPIYKVGAWQEEKIPGGEEKTFYYCVKDGKVLYPAYYEELYLVYRVNKDYQTSYYFASEMGNICKVKSKTLYRTKELVK